jgi:pimeloyl-ACP methyl ester carboxylesterase
VPDRSSSRARLARTASPAKGRTEVAVTQPPQVDQILELQRTAGNAAVTALLRQRAVPETPPATPAASNEQPLPLNDAFIEQVAHGMTYEDTLGPSQQELLRRYGYTASGPFSGKHDFQMWTFLPADPEAHPVPPIVSFRGTSSLDDVLADLEPEGIGMDQFEANRELIGAQLAAANRFGHAIVTGHSLGGALAQIAAVYFAPAVSRIVTFQSPAIDRNLVRQLENYNEQAGENAVVSSHYRMAGDPVTLGGEAFTPGVVTTFSQRDTPEEALLYAALGPAAGAAARGVAMHQSMPLTAAAFQGGHGDLLPGVADPGTRLRGVEQHGTAAENDEFRYGELARWGAGTYVRRLRMLRTLGGGLGPLLPYLGTGGFGPR